MPDPDLNATVPEEKPLGLADARETRIAELREEYLAGTYEVEALEVSSKLIDKHLQE